MTAQVHQRHTEAPAAQSPTPINPGPTTEEKAAIKEYVKVLKRRGWCKIDAENAKETRLFNRYSKTTRSFSYLKNNFDEWLDTTGNECDFYNERYFTRGLTHIVGQVFDPNGKDYTIDALTGCRYANTYRRHVPTTGNAEVSPLFHEFFERLFPDQRERHIVLQYISHMFQHPDERPSWHLMLLSEPGTGKGYMVQKILHPILNHTSVLYKFDQVMGRFSSVITENLLILLDDCKSKSDATQTQLKSLLSEERTYVERKFASGSMEPTYARFILASNEDKPLHLDDPHERRWFIPASLVHRHGDKHETQAFIKRLDEWLKQGDSPSKVYNWFMSYSLDGFDHKDVPDSAGLAAIVAMSRNPYQDFLEGFVSENTVFTYADLKQAFKDEGFSPPGDRELAHLLREAGYEKSQPRIDGKLQRLCHPVGMSLADIRAAFGASQPPF